jgi:uncharacterized protein (DUF2141 family)
LPILIHIGYNRKGEKTNKVLLTSGSIRTGCARPLTWALCVKEESKMRKFRIAVIITLIMLLVSVTYAQTGMITVNVTQIDVEGGGKVKIGIYDSNGFPDVGKEVVGVDIKVAEQSITYQFNNIHAGEYAVAVFQDKNNDGILNKSLFGAPKEPYGFSKNKYGMFGPPDFKDVSFNLRKDKAISLTIKLE